MLNGRLLLSISLITIGLNLGFNILPISNIPATAETVNSWAATLVGQEPGSRINVRSSPSMSAPIRHYGLVGDTVTILQGTKDSTGYLWFLVQFPKSKATGWVRGDFVAVSDSTSVPSQPVRMLPKVQGVRFQTVYEYAASLDAPALEKALIRDFPNHFAKIRYLYSQIDLNQDGRAELIAYLPNVCGSGGCTMMVYQPTGEGTYRLISRHTLIWNPIVVSNTTTNGWRDLVVYVAGGGVKPSYRVLKFDGSAYPSNPSMAPVVPAGTIVTGDAVIANQLTPGLGFPISNQP